MESRWLHQSGKEKLLLFCNGWGMDHVPFQFLVSHDWDVLMFSNYKDLVPDVDLNALFETHGDVVLVSWSMGVWAGQQVFGSYQNELNGSLAINGTLCPVHDRFGIPENVFRATLAQFDEKGRLKFYHRMCRDRALYRTFLSNQPERSLAGQKRELACLLDTVNCEAAEEAIYQRALVADHDFIMPTANQVNYWPQKKIRRVDGYHFLFYVYESWDELAGEAKGKRLKDKG